MEVHHVFACVNWQKAAAVSADASPGISHDVGIGMACGANADLAAYQQVARLQFVQKWGDVGANVLSPYLIDRWAYPWNRSLVSPDSPFDGGSYGEPNVAWEVYQVPLVYPAGVTGQGFDTQGHPVFVGPGGGIAANSLLTGPSGRPRTAIGSAPAGASTNSRCLGAEQWLEVRWQMNADDPYAQGATGWTNLTANQTIVGYGGFYVMICGRRFLTDGGKF